MFPFYCNKCFRRRKFETSLELYVSRCGHILCKECIQENCCICSRPFKAVPINKNMPPAMAEYFSSPLKQYQQFKKVMKFHHDQERRLVEHLCRSNEEEKKKVHNEIQGFAKLDDAIRRQVEHERERIRKLREYISYYDRRLEQARYMTPPITTQLRPRYPSRWSSVDNLHNSTNNNNMKRFSQPIRPNIIYPNSPTLSANNSSTTTEGTVVNKQKTPPPLLPFSQHKHLNPQLSYNSSD